MSQAQQDAYNRVVRADKPVGLVYGNPTRFNDVFVLGTFPLESPDEYSNKVFEAGLQQLVKGSRDVIITSERVFPKAVIVESGLSVSDLYETLCRLDDGFDWFIFGDAGSSVMCCGAGDRVAVLGIGSDEVAQFLGKLDERRYGIMLSANLEAPGLSEPVWAGVSDWRMHWETA